MAFRGCREARQPPATNVQASGLEDHMRCRDIDVAIRRAEATIVFSGPARRESRGAWQVIDRLCYWSDGGRGRGL